MEMYDEKDKLYLVNMAHDEEARVLNDRYIYRD